MGGPITVVWILSGVTSRSGATLLHKKCAFKLLFSSGVLAGVCVILVVVVEGLLDLVVFLLVIRGTVVAQQVITAQAQLMVIYAFSISDEAQKLTSILIPKKVDHLKLVQEKMNSF